LNSPIGTSGNTRPVKYQDSKVGEVDLVGEIGEVDLVGEIGEMALVK